jgi:hypothetical protein
MSSEEIEQKKEQNHGESNPDNNRLDVGGSPTPTLSEGSFKVKGVSRVKDPFN